MMFKSVAAFTALLAATSVLAVPAPLIKRAAVPVENIVFNPMITSPKKGDNWQVASAQTITWDTSMIPEELKNSTGTILLGYNENNSENLDIAHPLATGFKLTDGKANVNVPDVVQRDDYVVVLFGDSGNQSPEFTISGGDSKAATVSGLTAAEPTKST